MAEHGTRTMYVHYGCRCEACCKAEHQQYLKRKEAQKRKRINSKWGEQVTPNTDKRASQRKHNHRRWQEFKSRPSTHTRPIHWTELAEIHGMTCAICGCELDADDTWINDKGYKCYGRKYPTVDHIIPLRHGGTDTLDNVQLVCKHCNSSKGAKVNAIAS